MALSGSALAGSLKSERSASTARTSSCRVRTNWPEASSRQTGALRRMIARTLSMSGCLGGSFADDTTASYTARQALSRRLERHPGHIGPGHDDRSVRLFDGLDLADRDVVGPVAVLALA